MIDYINNSRRRSKRFKQFKDIMHCDECGLEMMVCDSRMVGGARRRRKTCPGCGNGISTYEISKEDLEMLIAKED